MLTEGPPGGDTSVLGPEYPVSVLTPRGPPDAFPQRACGAGPPPATRWSRFPGRLMGVAPGPSPELANALSLFRLSRHRALPVLLIAAMSPSPGEKRAVSTPGCAEGSPSLRGPERRPLLPRCGLTPCTCEPRANV